MPQGGIRIRGSSSPFVNWPFRSRTTTFSRCRCSICSFTEATPLPMQGHARFQPFPFNVCCKLRGPAIGVVVLERHQCYGLAQATVDLPAKTQGFLVGPVTHLALTIKYTPVQSCSASKSWRGGSVKLLLTRTPPYRSRATRRAIQDQYGEQKGQVEAGVHGARCARGNHNLTGFAEGRPIEEFSGEAIAGSATGSRNDARALRPTSATLFSVSATRTAEWPTILGR